MSKKPVKPTKSDCGGCYNNFYNGGGKTCWYLENATLERKKLVGVDDVPPWKTQPIKLVPSCWRGQRTIAIDPKRIK